MARFLAAVFCSGLFALAAAAQGAVSLSLVVTFSPTGTITVTLPDGTPVGTTSGTPTQIPAGYYTIAMTGPGACDQLPLLEIKGPGVDIFSDMTSGEVDYMSQEALFKPSSTYTWRNYDEAPGVLHTFTTGATIVNAAPVAAPVTHGQEGTMSSASVVGSATAKTLAVRVTPSGVVLAKKRLPAGRYVVTVKGAAKLVVTTPKHERLTIGARKTLTLTAGRWHFGAAAVVVMPT